MLLGHGHPEVMEVVFENLPPHAAGYCRLSQVKLPPT